MYTIRVHDHHRSINNIRCALLATLAADGRFTAQTDISEATARRHPEIRVSRVRLKQAKEYCGQHPGPCPVRGVAERKKKMTYLEWNDWVAFHNLVNGLLDAMALSADVFSKPMETKGVMWMRKGLRARVRYDWHEEWHPLGRRIRIWNLGSDSQFEQRVLDPVEQSNEVEKPYKVAAHG